MPIDAPPTDDADLGQSLGEAADLLLALSRASRLELLQAAVALSAETGECTIGDLAARTGRPLRELVDELVRLQRPGLVKVRGQRVTPDLDLLAVSAERLAAQHPVAQLLTSAPDLARFFRHGRLVSIPEDADTRSRIAVLLVELLPADLPLTEAEVNAALGHVYDHATLRRLLVDEGLLERGASQSYRRPVRAG